MGCTNIGGARIGTKYDSLPVSTWFFGGKAPKEDRDARLKTLKSFISGAREGNIYKIGSSEIEIVHYGRSPNKLGFRVVGRSNTKALTNTNIDGYIKYGAKLVRRREIPKQTRLW